MCALMAVSVLAGCLEKVDTKVVVPPPPPPGPKAIIKTRFGEMEMKFFPDLAPKHVENFVKLAKAGFYNGTIFHRVVPGFMIQGGDPNSAGSQFFIVVKDSNFLDSQYTVFGEVVKGMDVADKIVNLPRNPRNDLPNERVEITVAVE